VLSVLDRFPVDPCDPPRSPLCPMGRDVEAATEARAEMEARAMSEVEEDARPLARACKVEAPASSEAGSGEPSHGGTCFRDCFLAFFIAFFSAASLASSSLSSLSLNSFCFASRSRVFRLCSRSSKYTFGLNLCK